MSMQYDTAIVLGGGRQSNDTLNLRTINRLRKAVELYQEGLFARMILSGGISFSAPAGTTRSESSLMQDWLLAEGLPRQMVHLEEKSTDTLGNAFFSKVELLRPNDWKSILVVTSTFHVNRCRYLFRKVLGTDYRVQFAGYTDNISEEECAGLDRLENHICNIYARWLDSIDDGDTDAISKVLFEHHPGHAENPDFTKEQFIQLLYQNASS